MKRMARSHKRKTPGMNLTSLMDVFTILVFFLLTNTANDEALEPPKVITLPDSVVESKPRETVVLMVTQEDILIETRPIVRTADVIDREEIVIEEIREAMLAEIDKAINLAAKAKGADEGESVGPGDMEGPPEMPEVNILADRTIPFSMLKKVMSSCTSAGYTRISLAVIQKASQS
jgi:biopolymer transport protein ExbD